MLQSLYDKSQAEGMICYHLDYFFMHLFIPDHSFFAYFFPACLKLWFDQADHLGPFFHQFFYRGQHLGQRNKSYINGYKIHCFPNVFRRHIPDIGLFHRADPLILSQFPRQLIGSHINSIHKPGSVLQHAVRKSSCGRSYIHAHTVIQNNRERFHGLFQFVTATADILHFFAPHFNGCGNRKGLSGFVFSLIIYKYLSCHNDSFGLFSGFCQSSLYQKHIQTLFFFFQFCNSSLTFPATASAVMPYLSYNCCTVPCSIKRSGQFM